MPPTPTSRPTTCSPALRAGWPEVVAFVARNPANKPLITACRPVEVRDGVVVLGFPEDQAFLRDKAEQQASRAGGGPRHVLGRTVGVRCVAANIELGCSRPWPGTDDLVAQARRIFEGELADVGEVELTGQGGA